MFDYNLESGEIWLFETIGPEWAGMVGEQSVLTALQEMGGRDVTLRINSPGGDVIPANAIYNALERYSGRVTASIESLAASAASYIMLAADKVVAAENAMIMIHSPWSVAMGNASDLRASADVLDKFEDGLIGMYEKKTRKPRNEIKQALDAETWLTASEAFDWGLIDAVESYTAEPLPVPEGMYNHTPSALLKKTAPGSLTAYNRERAKIRIAAKS